jgi:hypothetical protein
MYRQIVKNIMSTKKEKPTGTAQNKIKVVNAEVIFANLTDEGFGTSLTIKLTPELEKQITEFWKTNNIGNEKTVIGEPNIKEYEGTRQLSLKINEHTKFAGLNGLTTDNLGFGARVNFFLNAFEYSNKFTKGKTYTGASISAVVILEGKRTGADADLSDLLNDLRDEDTTVEGNVSNNNNNALNEPKKPSGEVIDDLPF